MQYEYHTLHDYYTLYDQRQLVPGERFIRKRQAKIRPGLRGGTTKRGAAGKMRVPRFFQSWKRTWLNGKFCDDSNRYPDNAEDGPFFSRSQTIRLHGSRLTESNHA